MPTCQHRIGVLASKGWMNYLVLSTTLDTLLSLYRHSDIELVSVTSRDFVRLVRRYARENQYLYTDVYPSVEDTLMPGNYPVLHQLLQAVTHIVVFTDFKDAAINHLAHIAQQAQVPVTYVRVEPQPD